MQNQYLSFIQNYFRYRIPDRAHWIFRFSLTDVLEGDISRTQDASPAKFPKKRKGKAESEQVTKAEFDDNLRPNEELAIFGGNLRRFEERGKFSFWNIDENMQLLVPERKTVCFNVTETACNFNWKFLLFMFSIKHFPPVGVLHTLVLLKIYMDTTSIWQIRFFDQETWHFLIIFIFINLDFMFIQQLYVLNIFKG